MNITSKFFKIKIFMNKDKKVLLINMMYLIIDMYYLQLKWIRLVVCN